MLQEINIFIHVMCGIIAILIGVMPYVTEKGGRRHRFYGRLFLVIMSIVILTALNGVVFFRDRPFLTVITFLSFYFSWSGYRVLQTKDEGFQKIDFIVMVFVAGVGVSFLTKIRSANVLWDKSIVYYTLGYLFVILSFDMIRFLIPRLISKKGFWLYDHIFKMTGAFVALISAGVGTVLGGWEPYNQILPAVLGTVWLLFCLLYFPEKVVLKADEKADRD